MSQMYGEPAAPPAPVPPADVPPQETPAAAAGAVPEAAAPAPYSPAPGTVALYGYYDVYAGKQRDQLVLVTAAGDDGVIHGLVLGFADAVASFPPGVLEQLTT